jgi:RNA polymerase sigma factor (TIGR02999 family)
VTDLTRILEGIQRGDAKSAEELLPLVYNELRQLAARKMANESPNQTLQPTALEHEAWLRLTGNETARFENRAHFFGAAAEAMRRILIDRARRRRALRHGGGQQRLDIDEIEIALPAEEEQLLALNEALDKFATYDQRKAELVLLRYFAGMTIEEAAEVLGISLATAKRWWTYSRAWLYSETQRDADSNERSG